jgi:hypothetical protein
MQVILFSLQGAVILFHIVVWIGENKSVGSESNSTWLKTSRYSTIGIFSMFLFVYLIVLIFLTLRLKQYFPNFYQKEKWSIFVANGAIIFAIVSRISTNLWYLNNVEEIGVSYNSNTWLFPTY